jgi:hypothetical protein
MTVLCVLLSPPPLPPRPGYPSVTEKNGLERNRQKTFFIVLNIWIEEAGEGALTEARSVRFLRETVTAAR